MTNYQQAANSICDTLRLRRKDCPCNNCDIILGELRMIAIEETQGDCEAWAQVIEDTARPPHVFDNRILDNALDRDLHPTID